MIKLLKRSSPKGSNYNGQTSLLFSFAFLHSFDVRRRGRDSWHREGYGWLDPDRAKSSLISQQMLVGEHKSRKSVIQMYFIVGKLITLRR